jgi:hypothetical protein
MPKVFSDSGIIQIPPNPPLEKGGTTRNYGESPPLKKGDLGGFENFQGERIYGKRYNTELQSKDIEFSCHSESSAASLRISAA